MSISFPKSELAVIEKWREIKAFERQVGAHTCLRIPATGDLVIWLIRLKPLGRII